MTAMKILGLVLHWWHLKFDCENTHCPKKAVFPGIPTALTILSKVPESTIISNKYHLFYLSIWKLMVRAFQNTFTFDQYLFNSRSKMHVNLGHLVSLHPKNALLPTFSVKNNFFLVPSKKTKLKTYTIIKLTFVNGLNNIFKIYTHYGTPYSQGYCDLLADSVKAYIG